LNIFQRFFSLLLSIFNKPKYREPKKDVVKKRQKYLGYCEFCNIKKGFPDYFYCKYCEKYHCDKHRLPEQHHCFGNPTLPLDLMEKSTPISYSYKKK